MTRTHWWMLSAILSLMLTGAAASAQCTRSNPCGGGYTSPSSCQTTDCNKDEESADDEESAEEAKCPCDKCECKDGKCDCKKCKCGTCPCAKAEEKCDCAKSKCACEKCECSKAAAKTSCCESGCCAKAGAKKGCCGKGCCCQKDSKDSDKTVESEYVNIVLEDLTVNYFGAGMKIKRIKIRYKGQGLDAGDVAKDLSSIGRAAPTCCPMPCVAPTSCVPVTVPAPARR